MWKLRLLKLSAELLLRWETRSRYLSLSNDPSPPMAISVQHVVVLLLTSLLIAITFFLFTSDNLRFPLPSLSSDYTPLPKSSNHDVSSDQTPHKMKMKLNASHEEVVVKWDLCKGAESVDYIPCLDNRDAIKQLKSRRHMEHRERHCPEPTPKCLVPLPDNYKPPVPWPKSRDMVRDRSPSYYLGCCLFGT